MTSFFRVLKAVIAFLALLTVIEMVLVSYHYFKYGPYNYRSVEVKSYEAYCYRGFKGDFFTRYEIVYILEGESFKAVDPFIGAFPLEACIFGRLYVLQWGFLESLNKASETEVFLDKNNRVYFGKNSISYLIFSFLYFFICKAVEKT